ncbi:hypothetical protein BDZ91DRAFT_712034 [Kalaharituber pfeilii]|nr:hypothetical protein BDZ91DRAFT_712034 [Kalaharituber pfeilii]
MSFRSFTRTVSTVSKRLLPAESHQFFIQPTTMKPQPVSLSFYTTRLGRTASMYVPIYIGFFGWSFATARFLNWSNQVEGNPWVYGNRELALKGVPDAQL